MAETDDYWRDQIEQDRAAGLVRTPEDFRALYLCQWMVVKAVRIDANARGMLVFSSRTRERTAQKEKQR